ncbi:MAG: hypothetical protein HY832_02560 [Candidatus Aenigmarchaeota archaeon]|nr:hypothetical protein [Candidatus Aenigmarchaeota archaeon]
METKTQKSLWGVGGKKTMKEILENLRDKSERDNDFRGLERIKIIV